MTSNTPKEQRQKKKPSMPCARTSSAPNWDQLSELDRYLREGKTMNEIWLEFFQVEFNIPELRDKPLAQIRATPPEDFNTAYEALLRAKEKWQLIDIQERQWEIASTRNQKFYWVEANFFPGFKN